MQQSFYGALGHALAPVSLSNPEGAGLLVFGFHGGRGALKAGGGPASVGLGGAAGQTNPSLSVLAALGAISKARTLASSVQKSVFNSGPHWDPSGSGRPGKQQRVRQLVRTRSTCRSSSSTTPTTSTAT